MKIASRVAVGSTVVLALLGGAVASQRSTIARLASGQRHFQTTQMPRVAAAIDLLDGRNRLEEYLRKYYVTRDPAYARAAATTAGEIDAMLDDLKGSPQKDEQSIAINEVLGAWRLVPIRGISALDAPEFLATLEPREFLAGPGAPLDVIRRELNALLELTRSSVEKEAARATAAAERAERLSAGILAVALLVSVAVIVVTVQSINRPLKRLMAATHAVEAGDLGHRIEVRSRTELSLLAQRFNVMLQRLSELDRLKRDFLSNVSHEIKTPLVAMEETSRLLLEEVPGPLTEKQRRMLELNLDGQRRLARLIAELLELSRLESGVMEYRFAPARLSDVVNNAAEAFEASLRESDVQLAVVVDPEVTTTVCDRDRITQVVHNLLTNAIRFSPRGGIIELSVQPMGSAGEVKVRVTDEGPGIPDEDRGRVFDRFRQGAGPRSSANVGLGLAICREIVEAHGGGIRASDGPRGGASFELWLPAQPPPAEPVHGTRKEAP